MINKEDFKILQGNALDVLKTLPDKSVQMCVTSPPYYNLRDYGTATWVGGDPNCNHYRDSKYSENCATGHKHMMEQGEAVGDAIYKTVCPKCGAVRIDEQIGLEETPDEYIQRLVEVFREVKRVLKDNGTLWVNIGDTYNGTKAGNDDKKNSPILREEMDGYVKHIWSGAKNKDLIGIPWMLAFALRADGWYLRQDIIWDKSGNAMPESVTDRCTKAHEYVFLLSKSPKYLFNYDAIKEPVKEVSLKRAQYGWHGKGVDNTGNYAGLGQLEDGEMLGRMVHEDGRHKRDVWHINTNSYSGAHFATYPEELVLPCILAGSNEGDIVLDVFNGAATTGIVAIKNNRKYIGIELNPKYVKLSEERFNSVFNGLEPLSEPIISEGMKKTDLLEEI